MSTNSEMKATDMSIHMISNMSLYEYIDQRINSRMNSLIPTVTFKLDDAVINKPSKKYSNDAGYDIYALTDTVLNAGAITPVKTGVYLENLSNNCYIQVATRSSLALNNVSVEGGVIDSGYRGEIVVILRNGSSNSITIPKNKAIAQLITLVGVSSNVNYVTKSAPNSPTNINSATTGHSNVNGQNASTMPRVTPFANTSSTESSLPSSVANNITVTPNNIRLDSNNPNVFGYGEVRTTFCGYNPFARGSVAPTNPFAINPAVSSNPFAPAQAVSSNPFAHGSVASTNPFAANPNQRTRGRNGFGSSDYH